MTVGPYLWTGGNAGGSALGTGPSDSLVATTEALKVKNPGPGALPLLLQVGHDRKWTEGGEHL